MYNVPRLLFVREMGDNQKSNNETFESIFLQAVHVPGHFFLS